MSYKVLIVDDERIIRDGVSEMIQSYNLGFDVVLNAQNGQEAYMQIIKENPDLVITDIRMPIIDGLELIQKTKKIKAKCVFIILSGYGEFEIARQAMQHGVKYFLLKPFKEEEIINIIKEIKKELDYETISKPEHYILKSSTSLIIQKAIDYVNANLNDETLSLKKICKEVLFLNPDYFGKIFKKEMNTKFSTFLLNQRIVKAMEIMKTSDDFKIFEIAEEVGFGSDFAYFSNVFKKKTGLSPSEYRKQFYK